MSKLTDKYNEFLSELNKYEDKASGLIEEKDMFSRDEMEKICIACSCISIMAGSEDEYKSMIDELEASLDE